MKEAYEIETDGSRLKKKFAALKTETGMNKAAFARVFKVPGGASMISQHISGHRPIGLDAIVAYTKGFKCSVIEISPTLAAQLPQADANPPNEAQKQPLPFAAPAQSAPSFEDALRVVAMALDQADQSDRNAAKAYLVDLCDRPGEVDTFAAKLTRLLAPLPRQANGTNH